MYQFLYSHYKLIIIIIIIIITIIIQLIIIITIIIITIIQILFGFISPSVIQVAFIMASVVCNHGNGKMLQLYGGNIHHKLCVINVLTRSADDS